jgi:hypothetical protein
LELSKKASSRRTLSIEVDAMSREFSDAEDQVCFPGTQKEQRRVMYSDIIELAPLPADCLGQVNAENENASVETALGTDPQCPTCVLKPPPSDG